MIFIVLDPFCGSGTTCVAAKLLNRNYIGIDKSIEAIELSKSRIENLIKTESNLLKKGGVQKEKETLTESASLLAKAMKIKKIYSYTNKSQWVI